MSSKCYCVVCSNSCVTGVIQCSKCKKWMHSDCVNIAEAELPSWSTKHTRFFCPKCIFSGDEYNSGSALLRLRGAVRDAEIKQSWSKAEQAAKNERRLLQTYCVTLASQRHGRVQPSTDITSTEILKMYHPPMWKERRPLAVIGDGNCLYRSVSLSVTNTQYHHLLVRLLTAIELILNRSFYEKDSFLNEDAVVTSKFRKLLHDTITAGSFSELAHIYAISAAIRQPIQSYYPPQTSSRFSSGPFTRDVYGRDVRRSIAPKICVMWTMMNVPKKLPEFMPNHFVCLIKGSDGRTDHLDTAYSGKVSNNIDDNDDDGYDDDETSSSSFVLGDEESFDNVRVTRIDNLPSCFVEHNQVESSTCNGGSRSAMSEAFSHDNVMPNSDRSPSVNGEKLNLVQSPFTVNPIQLEHSMESDGNISERSETFSTDNVMPNLDRFPSDRSGQLKSGSFLDLPTIIQLLTNSSDGFPSVPAGRKENCYFVIDNGENSRKRAGSGRSTFTDDCGVWDASKGASPKTYYLIGTDGTLKNVYWRNGMFCQKRRIQGKVEYPLMEPQPSKDKIAVVQRYYAALKLDSSYKKRVSWLSEGGIVSKLAIVEYVGKFPGLAAHGNSRIPNAEFVRTPAHVIQEMSNELASKKPSEVFGILSNKFDEVTRPSSIQQVKDRKRQMSKANSTNQGPSRNVADQTIHLENMVAQNHPFVRSVIHSSNKSPSIILYTDDQLQDLRNFCCSGQTVLGIDKTFNLCDMHVTVTCFKQLSVERTSSNEHPIFLGPMFIHDNSDFASYCDFLNHIKVKLDCNLDRLLIGSDDERSLVKAIKCCFPSSEHILCIRHLRQNANQKLLDDAVTARDRRTLVEKVFGEGGIVDAQDEITFSVMCEDFEVFCQRVSAPFTRYFQCQLKPLLRSKVLVPCLSHPFVHRWTNNNCESMNHVLKNVIAWKSRPITELVNVIFDKVKTGYSQLGSALVGSGDFRLSESHSRFLVSKTVWTEWSVEQRQKHVTKFRKFVTEANGFIKSTDGLRTVVAPRTHGQKPHQTKRKRAERTRSFKVPKL